MRIDPEWLAHRSILGVPPAYHNRAAGLDPATFGFWRASAGALAPAQLLGGALLLGAGIAVQAVPARPARQARRVSRPDRASA
jgi:hypothetical protein